MVDRSFGMKSIAIRMLTRWNLIIAVLIAIVISIYINYERIIDPYLMGSIDSRSLYFIYGFVDKTILTNDLLVQAIVKDPYVYLSSIPLIKPLFFITVFLVRFFYLSLALTIHSIAYQIITAIVVFKIGKSLIDYRSAFALMVVFLIYTSSMDSFYGGMVRGSGFLIISILYYCMIKKYVLQAILLIPIAFICYPPILPVVVIVSFFSAFRSMMIDKKGKFTFFLLVTVTIAILFISFYVNQRLMKSTICELTMSERFELSYYSFCKAPLFYFLNDYILNISEHRDSYAYLTYALLLVASISMLRKEKPSILSGERIFIASSLFSFAIVFFMNEGIATRQLIFSFPLFLIIYCWKIFINTFKKYPRLKFVILVVIIFVFVISKRYIIGLESRDRSYYKKAFSYISKLPKQALIAGHPVGASLVPYFTKKSVFFIDVWDLEVSLLSSDCKKIFNKRKHDLLEAMYASEPTAIVSFIEKYKITDFLIEDYYYSHDYYSQEFSNNAHTFDGKEYQDIINTIRMNNENFFLLDAAHKYGHNFGNGIYILPTDTILKIFSKKTG